MNVIGHKTICKNLESIFVGLLFEQFKKNAAVVIDKENILTIIPSLRDMMGALNRNRSGYSWHTAILNPAIPKVDRKTVKNSGCPHL
jgi:hypothetical protein